MLTLLPSNYATVILLCICCGFWFSNAYADENASPVPIVNGENPSSPSTDTPAEPAAVLPACIKLSQAYLDVAANKSSRVDNNLLEGLEGKTIRSIAFKSIDVFDEENPDENNRVYLFLNKLHANTRSGVIESQLLFKAGDSLNAKKIQESERILRTRGYLSNAYVLPVSVCGDQVDLLVATQDSWALEPQVSFSKKSESSQSGFGISDGNILGTGNSLTITYSENEQRNGVSYDFRNPHFLNKQVDVRVYYEDTNDGLNSIVDISRPFYSLATPLATGIRLETLSLVEVIRARGEIVNEFRHKTVLNEVFIGKATSVTDHYTRRWLLGFTDEKEEFFSIPETLQGLPTYQKSAYPWVEYQYLENKFGVFKNVNQIQRPEDIALGKNFSFRLGYGGESFDNPDDVIRFKGLYTNIIDVRDKHILEYGVKLDGKQHLQISDFDPVIIKTHVSYNYFEDEKNRWYARVAYNVGQDLAQHQELTVGSITGLRGYPTDFVRGKKSFVFTLERRYFSDFHIFNLLRVGGVAFFDMGKAWGLQDPYAPLLSDVGVGLRLSSTKVRIGNVVHIDVAVPTAERSGISEYQLTIGAESKF